MASSSSAWKSKKQIQCYHCDVSMRRDRLGEHTRDKHPGLQKREKGESASRNILQMLGGAGKRTRDQYCSVVESMTGSKEKRGKADASTDRQEDDLSEEPQFVDVASQGPAGSRRQVEEGEVGAGPVPESNDEVKQKLDLLLNMVSRISLSPAHVGGKESQSVPPPTFVSEDSALATLVQSSRSIRRVCDLAKLSVDDEKSVLVCDVCFSDSNAKSRCFHYDFSLGVDFTGSNQPLMFTNLKKSIARHIMQVSHQKAAILKDEDADKQRRQKALEKSIGMVVGKQAYRLLKFCRPFSDFEVEMTLLADAHVRVGNLNHSRKFPAELRPSFATAIDSRLKELLGTRLEATLALPPTGIIADKLTTKRRTGQMFGCILFTPGMPNLLTLVSFDMYCVKKHDGESISDDISEVCREYHIHSDQIAGFGFDGQYFHLNVPAALEQKLGLKEANFMWDNTHLLQLAEKDMRKTVPWIDDICADISVVLNKFSYGKNFESALDKAENMGLAFKAPLKFSETRFASYASDVFQNFLQDYSVVRGVLEDIAASDHAKDAEMLLRRIRTVKFVAKAVVCSDFYRLLETLSQKLQTVDLPFWTRAEAIVDFSKSLTAMSSWEMEYLKSFDGCEKDLEQGTFAGLPILAKDSGLVVPLRETRGSCLETDEIKKQIDSIKIKAKQMFSTMREMVDKRFPQSYFDEIRDKAHATSLFPILVSARESADQATFISSASVTLLASKHQSQVEGIKNLCTNIYNERDSLVTCKSETELLHRVFTSPKLFAGAHHFLGTLAKTYSSFPPESVIESMGSVVEKIREIRGGSKTSTVTSDLKAIGDELIIHWNGPNISCCDSIVKQALDLHFQGRSWHFVSTDVRAKMHKVSKVVDRINKIPPSLSIMTK